MCSYEMARSLCEAGLAGIAIVDILQEFGESAIKELHADFGMCVAASPRLSTSFQEVLMVDCIR